MTHAVRNPIQVIKTDKAGPPVGPYSQGIKAGGFVFVAGEKGLDPATGKIVPGGIEAETRRTLENVKAILEAAGEGVPGRERKVANHLGLYVIPRATVKKR